MPKTHGELRQYMAIVGNHKNRYAFVQSNREEFETFKDDENFLLMLMSKDERSSTKLPVGAADGAKAINKFLEPSVAGSTGVIRTIGSFTSGAFQRMKNLMPRWEAPAQTSEDF